MARQRFRLGRIHTAACTPVALPMSVRDVVKRGIVVDDVGVREMVIAAVAVSLGYTRRSVRGEHPEQQHAEGQDTGATAACPRSPRGTHGTEP